jgi:hypothetical protein
MSSNTAVHPDLTHVLQAADRLSASLVNPVLLVTLHRDIDGLVGKDGKPLGRTAKQYALRWGTFSMAYAAIEGFFNDALTAGSPRNRPIPLSPDKLRAEGNNRQVRIFTNEWGVRTVTPGHFHWSRARWRSFVGTQALRYYLGDMKSLRDRLNHGGDVKTVSNDSSAMWPVAGGHSMSIMGVEGFIQACTDLAAQTVLAYGGTTAQLPTWPQPQRSGLSAEKRPPLPLMS